MRKNVPQLIRAFEIFGTKDEVKRRVEYVRGLGKYRAVFEYRGRAAVVDILPTASEREVECALEKVLTEFFKGFAERVYFDEYDQLDYKSLMTMSHD